MAAWTSVSRAWLMASGIVCVRPAKLPANVMVAPNSPSARAHASALPAPRAPRIDGTVTRRSGQTKDEMARAIAERDGITEGLVCILRVVEPCKTFSVGRR